MRAVLPAPPPASPGGAAISLPSTGLFPARHSRTARARFRHVRGKVVVITGAGSGIGRATAQLFGRLGARVHLADLNAEAVEAVRGEIDGAVAHTVDCSDPAAVEALAERVFAAEGRVDVLHNNAGVGHAGDLEATTVDDWQRVIGVNLLGVAYGVQAFAPRMLSQGGGGSIVNTASAAGLFGIPEMAPYCASKWGVVGMTEALDAELRPRGIRGGQRGLPGHRRHPDHTQRDPARTGLGAARGGRRAVPPPRRVTRTGGRDGAGGRPAAAPGPHRAGPPDHADLAPEAAFAPIHGSAGPHGDTPQPPPLGGLEHGDAKRWPPTALRGTLFGGVRQALTRASLATQRHHRPRASREWCHHRDPGGGFRAAHLRRARAA